MAQDQELACLLLAVEDCDARCRDDGRDQSASKGGPGARAAAQLGCRFRVLRRGFRTPWVQRLLRCLVRRNASPRTSISRRGPVARTRGRPPRDDPDRPARCLTAATRSILLRFPEVVDTGPRRAARPDSQRASPKGVTEGQHVRLNGREAPGSAACRRMISILRSASGRIHLSCGRPRPLS